MHEMCQTASKNDLFVKLNSELKEVRNLNDLFFKENKDLNKKIFELEKQIDELKTQISNISNSNSCRPLTLPGTPPPSDPPIAEPIFTENDVYGIGSANEPKLSFSFNSVHVLADSHGRGLREKLERNFRDFDINVSSEFYPGAPMCQYFKSVGKSSLTKKDSSFNVVMGGVNDTQSDSVDRMIELVSESSNCIGTIAVVETPYRYDNVQLNESIRQQNIKLQELCSKYGWFYIPINSSLFRKHYTRQGLHLNYKGKDVVCSIIADYLVKIRSAFLENY